MGKYIYIILFFFFGNISLLQCSTINQSMSKKFLNSLIEKQKYNRALDYLKKSKNFFYFKGVCYLNLLDYKNALFNFLQAQKYENITDSKKLNFYIGICYYKLQDFQNAIKYLKLASKSDKVNFFIGLSNYYIGNYSDALSYFRNIKKEFKNEADYFAALTTLKLDKKKAAFKILKNILSNNPEPYLRDQIENQLDFYNKSKININLLTTVSYDSNVLREPESSSSKSTDKGDIYNEIFFNINKKFTITEEFNIKPEFTFYKATYQDLNEYNLKGFSLGPNLSFFNEKIYIHIKPFYENFELDDKNYQKNYKLLTEIFLNNFKKNYLNIKFLLGKKNFFKYNFKDCNFFNVYINQFIRFNNNYYRLGVSFKNEDADIDIYSYKGIGISEGFGLEIFKNFLLKSDIYFDYRDYDNSKVEKTLQIIFNFTYLRFKYFQIGAIFKYLNNMSNFNDFDYSSYQSTFYITFKY